MTLKELRKELRLTQPEAAAIVGVPFRTYCRYEDEARFIGTFKYNQMISVLKNHEKNIVLDIDSIKERVTYVCQDSKVTSVYLFGSYAKGKARPDSDIDLMITGEIEGIEFYQLMSDLEKSLKKKIDLIRLEVAVQNVRLLNEILNEGIKIYG